MARENQGQHSPEQILAQAQAVIDTGDACSAARSKDETTRMAFWSQLAGLAVARLNDRETHAFKVRPDLEGMGVFGPETQRKAIARGMPSVASRANQSNNVVAKRPPVARAPVAKPAPNPAPAKFTARPTALKSINPRPRRSITLNLGEPHTAEDALRLCDEIFEMCDVVCEMGDAGADFSDSVREGAEEVMGWVESHREVTDGQFVSLENWRDGLSRWIK